MVGKPTKEQPRRDKDEDRVAIPLDPETALRALMETGPHVEPDPKPTESQRKPTRSSER